MSKPRHGQKAFIQSKIINTLRAAGGGWINTPELIDKVYGTAASEAARTSLTVIIHLLRKQGWPIASALTRGYRYAPELFIDRPSASAAE